GTAGSLQCMIGPAPPSRAPARAGHEPTPCTETRMSYETLEIDNTGGVARIWLNRPDVRNAMNATLIAELAAAIDAANADDTVRVIMLGGRGKGFCAGADLKWMGSGREMSAEDNRADTG